MVYSNLCLNFHEIHFLAQIIYKNHMPNTNKIQLMLAGAFVPEYYSYLATHFLNIWVEFETFQEYIDAKNLGLKNEDIRHRVCLQY